MRIVQTDSGCQPDIVAGHRHSWVAEVRQQSMRVSGRPSWLNMPVPWPSSARHSLQCRHSGSTVAPLSVAGRRRPERSRWRQDRLSDVRRCRWHMVECPGPRCRSRHSPRYFPVTLQFCSFLVHFQLSLARIKSHTTWNCYSTSTRSLHLRNP